MYLVVVLVLVLETHVDLWLYLKHTSLVINGLLLRKLVSRGDVVKVMNDVSVYRLHGDKMQVH